VRGKFSGWRGKIRAAMHTGPRPPLCLRAKRCERHPSNQKNARRQERSVGAESRLLRTHGPAGGKYRDCGPVCSCEIFVSGRELVRGSDTLLRSGPREIVGFDWHHRCDTDGRLGKNAPVEPQGLATSSQPRNGPLGSITRRAAVDGQPQAPMARQRGCPSKILQRLTLLACNFRGQSPSRTLMPLATSGAGPTAAARAPGEVRRHERLRSPVLKLIESLRTVAHGHGTQSAASFPGGHHEPAQPASCSLDVRMGPLRRGDRTDHCDRVTSRRRVLGVPQPRSFD
jgi:hypothetical protein